VKNGLVSSQIWSVYMLNLVNRCIVFFGFGFLWFKTRQNRTVPGCRLSSDECRYCVVPSGVNHAAKLPQVPIVLLRRGPMNLLWKT